MGFDSQRGVSRTRDKLNLSGTRQLTKARAEGRAHVDIKGIIMQIKKIAHHRSVPYELRCRLELDVFVSLENSVRDLMNNQ